MNYSKTGNFFKKGHYMNFGKRPLFNSFTGTFFVKVSINPATTEGFLISYHDNGKRKLR